MFSTHQSCVKNAPEKKNFFIEVIFSGDATKKQIERTLNQGAAFLNLDKSKRLGFFEMANRNGL